MFYVEGMGIRYRVYGIGVTYTLHLTPYTLYLLPYSLFPIPIEFNRKM